MTKGDPSLEHLHCPTDRLTPSPTIEGIYGVASTDLIRAAPDDKVVVILYRPESPPTEAVDSIVVLKGTHTVTFTRATRV
jgi:hypothetical protein